MCYPRLSARRSLTCLVEQQTRLTLRPEGKQCGGFTGAVIRATSSGQEVYAAGFVSGAGPDGNGATGNDDIAISPGGTVYGIVTQSGRREDVMPRSRSLTSTPTFIDFPANPVVSILILGVY